MSDQSNNLNNDRNLVDVFKDLQQKRAEDTYIYQQEKTKDNGSASGITTYFSSNKRKAYNPYTYRRFFKRRMPITTRTFNYTKLTVGIIILILIVSVGLLFLGYSFTTYGLEEEETVAQASEPVNLESNNNVLDITKIISGNVDTSTIKETVNEERETKFSTKYTTVDNLPKGEEKITQEGVNGSNKVEAVRTYKDGEMVEETIISSTVVKEAVPQLVQIGTSEFLYKYKVHLGDIMYVLDNTTLRKAAKENSESVAEIPATLDVNLVELAGDWCKVSYDGKQGYVKASSLTSASEAPEMVDKARIQRILRDVKEDMPLNKKSGLSTYDYQTMLTGLPQDTNKVFENNYQAFFEAEQKYNINGVFLAAIAINESGWGASEYATERYNLFGWQAYDSDPDQAFKFDDYKDAIDTVAQGLVLHYLNPKDTEVFEHKKAVGEFYHEEFGPTVEGVNQKYASDKEWHNKVYNYMVMLYNRLVK